VKHKSAISSPKVIHLTLEKMREFIYTLKCFLFTKRQIRKHNKFPKVVLLIGVPGSGKSTHAKQRFQPPTHSILSTDTIREELFGDESVQGDWHRIESLLRERVASFLAKGTIPVIDATHAQQKHRAHAIKWIRKLGAEVHAVYVATPLAICKERNQRRPRKVPEAVITSMYAALQKNPPAQSEGFQSIEVVHSS
jgi:predicted kinase